MKNNSVRNILEGRMTQTRRFTNYGEVGDFLLVKESFGIDRFGYTVYSADHEDMCVGVEGWYSGRHMRKGQCRIMLQLTGKWIEPILDISEEDAAAVSGSWEAFYRSACQNFGKILVDSNPLITAYRFKVITLERGLQAFEAAFDRTLGPDPDPVANPSERPLQRADFGPSHGPVGDFAVNCPRADHEE